jgi:hypothetical protein
MSHVFRPFLLNRETNWPRLAVGNQRLLLARDVLAVATTQRYVPGRPMNIKEDTILSVRFN